MKAAVCTEYGPPDVLQVNEVETPTPKPNEVLAAVHATSVNAADLETLRGDPIVRIGAGRRPRYEILGSDIAGRVEAVGRDVTQFRPGDEVWGDLSAHGFGAFAEHLCVPEEALRPKPANMTFEEAAAIPTAGVVALQNLRGAGHPWPSLMLSNEGRIQPGQRVLINGAGGGVGTFAVQIAKSYGADVTGVDSGEKRDMLRSIGADHVIDYTQTDYTKTEQRYDLILDVVARRSIFASMRALGPEGVYVFVGGSTAAIFQSFFLGALISATTSKAMGVVMWEPNKAEDLARLAELFEAGTVVPIIDRRYPLEEVAEALRYLGEGRQQGKVVITVDHSNS